MARGITEDIKGLPKDVREALGQTRGMKSSSEQLRYLKSRGLKPVTSLTVIRKMAKKSSQRHKVPIKISKYIGKGEDAMAEGLATFRTKTGKASIVLHPSLQYRTKKHAKSVLEHELDHIKVYRKWKKYKKLHGLS